MTVDIFREASTVIDRRYSGTGAVWKLSLPSFTAFFSKRRRFRCSGGL